MESSLSADGLRFQNASSETRHDWSAFSGWIESESVIVLCLSNFKGAFLTLPTRAITGADVHQRLRALLIEHLGPALVTRGQVRSQQLHHKASA
ncbi:YcxB family protein [Pedococcus bigeumensis]|uniref:YcxB family protein n=1 Tax=Pedococcus bigeumensis TaxID=433644 RepID=UPI001386A3BC|nr:YcxB family protein [Pedococcus bigeumensis]